MFVFFFSSLTHTSLSHVVCNTSHTCCISALWLNINREVWDTKRFTAHLQCAEWWLAGRKSIAGGKVQSCTQDWHCYCLRETLALFHEAGVFPGTKADAWRSSLISIRAMDYKSPLCGVWCELRKVKRGMCFWLKSRCFMMPGHCMLDKIVYCSSCESFGSTLSVPVLLFSLNLLSSLQA